METARGDEGRSLRRGGHNDTITDCMVVSSSEGPAWTTVSEGRSRAYREVSVDGVGEVGRDSGGDHDGLWRPVALLFDSLPHNPQHLFLLFGCVWCEFRLWRAKKRGVGSCVQCLP